MTNSSRCAAGVVATLLCAMTGCYADAPPPPPAVSYTETTAAPVDIETYPSVVYEGQPVYFYGDRWWHRDGARWSAYQTEPAELHQQREVVLRSPKARVRVAPPRAEVREEHR